jgi:hypothetical protein
MFVSAITHVNTMSRGDGGPKPYMPENAEHKLDYHPESETFLLTITDRANPEFRVRTSISKDELDKALATP